MRSLRTILLHVALVALALASMTPLIWLVCAAFKRPADLHSTLFLPPGGVTHFTAANFRTLLARQPFGAWMINSLFLASLQTVLVVTLSSLGGFALAKYEFRGKRALMFAMLVTLVLPGQVLLPSLYELTSAIGWINSYRAIVIPGAVSVFGIFLFRQAMRAAVPDELLHAARVDGCSELRLWWEIALPIVRPTIGAFTLLSFLAAWNSFFWPQVILQDEAKYTLPIGLANMVGLPEFQTNYGVLMAGTLLATLPVIALFFAVQRDFLSGLTSGAVKG